MFGSHNHHQDRQSASHHHPGQGGDVAAAANKAYFDETAHKYEEHPLVAQGLPQKYVASTFVVALQIDIFADNRLGDAALKVYAFEKGITTVMDFACGTGMHMLSSSSLVNQPLRR